MKRPAFKIPTMAQVRRAKRNGLTAISTFAGCGGSSIGYRLAGFRLLWASEFVESARDAYLANCAAGTVLDASDIRDVKPKDVLSAAGIEKGELDLLDGSPPCASFSLSGKREKTWGEEKQYSETRQRTDDLPWEFIRMVRGLKPRVFVMENVKGLSMGKSKGVLLAMLKDMRRCGYVVEVRLLNAKWLGVPQNRERLIFVGVRRDQKKAPVFPSPLPYSYSMLDACPWLDGSSEPPPIEGDCSLDGYAVGKRYNATPIGGQHPRVFNLGRPDPFKPCPTVLASVGFSLGASCAVHPYEKRRFSIAELKRFQTIPDDFVLNGSYQQNAERCGRAVPPVMMRAIATKIAKEILLCS